MKNPEKMFWYDLIARTVHNIKQLYQYILYGNILTEKDAWNVSQFAPNITTLQYVDSLLDYPKNIQS